MQTYVPLVITVKLFKTLIDQLMSPDMIQKDGHRSIKTVDAAVGYQDPQRGKKFISVIN